MKITDIESLALRFEYDEGFRYAGGRCTARVTNLVRVHTDTGAVGLGAAYSHPGLVHLVIQDQLAPMLLDRDPPRVGPARPSRRPAPVAAAWRREPLPRLCQRPSMA